MAHGRDDPLPRRLGETRIPNWLASNEDALSDMRQRAGLPA